MRAPAVFDSLATLSAYARQLLERPHVPVEPAIRAELFGAQRFKQHGLSLARAQPVQAPEASRRGAPFFPRVHANLASLRSAFDYIALISQTGRYVSPAAEWLLDNFHLVEAQLQAIREGVPRSYYTRLPKLSEAPLAGLPRVYGIAWAYVAHTDSVLNKELFTAFLDAYQDVDELTLGELWALPTTLRVVLLENLRRLAEGIARNKVARELAHAVWDGADRLSNDDLDSLFATIRDHGLEQSYCTQLWQRLPGERAARPPALVAWTEKNCPHGPPLIERAQTDQVAANLTVGNIITTLRMIGQVDWADLIEPVSRSLRVLRELPSFAAESELTRQQITHAMEQVARTSARTERSVAEAVLDLAHAAGRTDKDLSGARHTAGYYLFGRGRADLVASLAPDRTAGNAARRSAATRAGAPPPPRLAAADLPRVHRREYRAAARAGGARTRPCGVSAARRHDASRPSVHGLAIVGGGDRAAASHRRGIDPGSTPAEAGFCRRHPGRASSIGRRPVLPGFGGRQCAAGPAARDALPGQP